MSNVGELRSAYERRNWKKIVELAGEVDVESLVYVIGTRDEVFLAFYLNHSRRMKTPTLPYENIIKDYASAHMKPGQLLLLPNFHTCTEAHMYMWPRLFREGWIRGVKEHGPETFTTLTVYEALRAGPQVMEVYEIEVWDIEPLLNFASRKIVKPKSFSFAWVKSNQEAVLEHGWRVDD